MADQDTLELEAFPSEGEHDGGAAETDTELDQPVSPQDEQGKLRCAIVHSKRFGGCRFNITQRRRGRVCCCVFCATDADALY